MESNVASIVIGLAVIALVVVRQLRARPAKETSAARIVLVLGIIGVVETVSTARHHAADRTAVALVVVGLLVGAVLGVARGLTVRVWREPDGVAWQRGGAITIVLWVLSIGSHLGLGLIDDSATAQALTSSSILLFLAVSLGAQREIVRLRAGRVASPTSPVSPVDTTTSNPAVIDTRM